jgi:hypothetical protein
VAVSLRSVAGEGEPARLVSIAPLPVFHVSFEEMYPSVRKSGSLSWFSSSSSSALASFKSSVSKALSEPVIDRGEKIVGLLSLTLITPQSGHARRGAQFPGFCLLLTRDRERADTS